MENASRRLKTFKKMYDYKSASLAHRRDDINISKIQISVNIYKKKKKQLQYSVSFDKYWRNPDFFSK